MNRLAAVEGVRNALGRLAIEPVRIVVEAQKAAEQFGRPLIAVDATAPVVAPP